MSYGYAKDADVLANRQLTAGRSVSDQRPLRPADRERMMLDVVETLTPRKRIGWTPIVLIVAVLFVAALALNAWNHNQQQGNVDVNTDRLVTELCADTPDC